jgi:polyhydroxybutyrate depolymerase
VAQRPYRAELPPGYDGRAAPVVIEVPGFDDDAPKLERVLRLRDATRAHGAILVFVEGTTDPDGHRYWNTGAACCDLHGERRDDFAYLDAVLDDLAARYAVDPARVYMVGHSNGGFMVHAYACARAERIAGIVSIAGAGPAEPCAPRADLAVLEIHGDADELVGTNGGNVATAMDTIRSYGVPITGRAKQANFPPIAATLGAWAAKDGCGAPAPGEALDLDRAIPGAETLVTEWRPCRAGGVASWTIRGGHHAPDLADGWGERLFAFFAAHPVTRRAAGTPP